MAPRREQDTHLEQRLGQARAEVERRVFAGPFAGVEELREEFPEIWSNSEAALELIYTEYVTRIDRGQSPDPAEWYRRFPEFSERLERLFGMYELMAGSDRRLDSLTDTVPDNKLLAVPGGTRDHPVGYTLGGEIGRGGSAVVYRARQHSLNREVAVKVIRTSPLSEESDSRSLLREAELAGRLQHPNIVQVFEVGEWNGMPFLSMELVAGRGLHTALAEAGRPGSTLATPERAAELVETLARAVGYAHERGVVHRDLKPANILIGPESAGTGDAGTLKIVDFGLALVCDSTAVITQSLSVTGTPCYMAPEQAEARVKEIGPCSDLYALGAILYELLTARPPFLGATVVETLDLVRATEPIPPRSIRPRLPRDLETICLKCLSKSPDRRYATALELADDLRRFRDGRPIVARPVSAMERAYMGVRRHPAFAGLSFALFALLVSVCVLQSSRFRESEAARKSEQKLNAELQASLAGKIVASAQALWSAGQVTQARKLLKECPEQFRDGAWETLRALCHAEVACWTDLDFVGDSLAVSRDGAWIAAHCKGSPHQVRVVSAQNRQAVASLDATPDLIQLEFISDDKSLVLVRLPRAPGTPRMGPANAPLDTLASVLGKTPEPAAEVTVWAVDGMLPVRRWSIPNPGSLAISGDGTRIAGRRGRRLGVWDSGTGELLKELSAPIDVKTRYQLAWDRSGAKLAVRLASEIQIWDARDATLIRTLPVDSFDMSRWEPAMPILKNFAEPVFLRPDGELILANPARPLATTNDGLPTVRSLIAWNVADGKEVFQIATTGISPRVEFAPDSRRMAIVGQQVIELHDARTGHHLATLRGHTANIHMVQFSPDGRRLYSVAGDKTLRTWDISPWCE